MHKADVGVGEVRYRFELFDTDRVPKEAQSRTIAKHMASDKKEKFRSLTAQNTHKNSHMNAVADRYEERQSIVKSLFSFGLYHLLLLLSSSSSS